MPIDRGTVFVFALLVGILPMWVILSGSPAINNLALLGVYPGEQITTTFMTTQATAVAYSTGTVLMATTEVAVVNVPTTIVNTQVLVTTQAGVVTTQTQSVTQTQIVTTQSSTIATVTGQTTYSSSTTVTALTTVSTFVPTGWSCPSGYICTGTVGSVYYACPSGQILTAGGCVTYYGSTGSGGSGLANPPTGGAPPGGSDYRSNYVNKFGGALSWLPTFGLTPQVVTGFNGQEVLLSGQAQVVFVVLPLVVAALMLLRKRQ